MEEKLELLIPTAQYADEYRSYRRDFIESGDSMDGAGPIRRIEDPYEWLAEIDKFRDPATVPEGWVESSQFIYVRQPEGRVVGMIQVRHRANKYIEKYAGHIGYSVRPSERRKGYATQMLKAVLPYCAKIGLDSVIVSCIDTNEASRRVILANGGVYEETVFEPKAQIYLQKYRITLIK